MSPPVSPDNHGWVEIRIYLDSVERPAGRLRVLSGLADALNVQDELPFTGWLGMLRALNEVIAGPGTVTKPGATPS